MLEDKNRYLVYYVVIAAIAIFVLVNILNPKPKTNLNLETDNAVNEKPSTEDLITFHSNYGELITACVMYMNDQDEKKPKNIDDLAPYLDDVEELTSTPKGASYGVSLVPGYGTVITAKFALLRQIEEIFRHRKS